MTPHRGPRSEYGARRGPEPRLPAPASKLWKTSRRGLWKTSRRVPGQYHPVGSIGQDHRCCAKLASAVGTPGAVFAHGGVAHRATVDGLVQRPRDGIGEREVHLGDPHRQDASGARPHLASPRLLPFGEVHDRFSRRRSCHRRVLRGSGSARHALGASSRPAVGASYRRGVTWPARHMAGAHGRRLTWPARHMAGAYMAGASHGASHGRRVTQSARHALRASSRPAVGAHTVGTAWPGRHRVIQSPGERPTVSGHVAAGAARRRGPRAARRVRRRRRLAKRRRPFAGALPRRIAADLTGGGDLHERDARGRRVR